MTVTYEFKSSAGDLTLDDSQLIQHNPFLTHTGKGDLQATFEETRDLDDYAQRQDRLNVKFNGTTKWTGYIIGASHNERSGTTTIKADGIAKRLEETRPDYDTIGGPVTYSNTALQDAIRDYWGRTEFSNFSVTDQTTETIATDEIIQSADTTTEWENVTSLLDDEPLEAANGHLELKQSCFTQEAENRDRDGGSVSAISDSDSSNGGAMVWTGNGQYAEWDFTLDYDMPESDFILYFRFVKQTDSGNSNRLEFYIDGYSIGVFEAGTGFTSYSWQDSSSFGNSADPFDLSAGSHTLRIEQVIDNADDPQIDVVAPADSRFNYTLDNTLDSNNYLSGPELYPKSYSEELDIAGTKYNIDSAEISATWQDITNQQAMALSNDGGANYTSSSNTTSLTVNFSSAGREARSKFTFSRYGSRTTATPTTGFNGQYVSFYELAVDLNDLVVIDSLELTRNHFDNLQSLHDYGNFVWVIEHDSSSIGNLVVSSFQEGDETRTAPSEWGNPQNKNPEIKAKHYFNSVYLEGAKDDTGSRPSAEVKDDTAISNDGREIQVFLRDLSITTEGGAAFAASSLLESALKNDDLVGTITSSPDVIDPGYARGIDFGNGTENKTVEEVSLSQSNDELVATYDFTVRSDFGEEISKLKRAARQLENQV